MALYLSAKAPGALYRYSWVVPVAAGDSVSAASATVSTGTVTITDSEVIDNSLALALSGGAAGEVAKIAASATTADGETIVETIYLPIRSADNLLGNTVYDVCAFALRKIAGIGETADADELSVAVEYLNDMLAEWRIDGLDVGVAKLLASTDDFTVRDEFIAPIKNNLTVRLAEEFDRPLTPVLVANAERGRRLIENALISFAAQSFEGPCLPSRPLTGIDAL